MREFEMARRPGRAYIGTSGWHYQHWRGPFYPKGTPASGFFGYYAQRFGTVEINNTFYRLPGEGTFIGWKAQAPPGFCYAVKASRYITHMKKLKDASGPLDGFLKRAELLGRKLGPVLFQLPPRWQCNPERLGEFLGLLPGGHRYAFEFRDPSWFCPAVYGLLKNHSAGLCIYDISGRQSPTEATAGFVYMRLHGPGEAYAGSYSDKVLRGWAGAIKGWLKEGRDVYCYFDNDEAAYAAKDALRLIGLLRGGSIC